MKKLCALILSAALLCTYLTAGAANLPADGDISDILNVMEIMTYNSRGSFDEGSYVTRAALAKILVSASQYKGAATASSRISPFSDVLHTHWAAPYISVASKNKFMTGYSDGNFRPDRYVLYEEAISAMLRLLGYTNNDYTGPYPSGQLSKAADIGLTDNITVYAGSPMTRRAMSHLVYNMLNTPAKGTQNLYVQSLGYTLSSELLTIGDVIKDNVTGPNTVKPGTVSALGMTSPKVYRDGKQSSESDIRNYDVIYYSKKSNTIWAYSRKITGVLNTISPNKESPTSVTVSGSSYNLPYYSAQRAFGLDGLEPGETVTMLLDKNGAVCDAYKTESLYQTEIGVVTDVTAKTITAADGSKQSGYFTTILMLDGSTIDLEQATDSRGLVGKAVQIDYHTNEIKAITNTNSSISGFINAEALMWGSYAPLSADVKILELDDDGNALQIPLARLDGVNLKSSSVILSSKNSSGAIDGMIIKNVTGDTLKYGLVTAIKRNTIPDISGGNAPTTYVYSYDINGTPGSATFNGVLADASEGPAVFLFEDGVLKSIQNLKRADKLLSVNPSYIQLENGQKQKISPNVLVYKLVDDTKIKTDINEAVSHSGAIWAYYDKPQSEGGLIRVIYLR